MPWPAWVVYAIIQLVVSLALIELTARTPKSNLKAKGLSRLRVFSQYPVYVK